jgi:hypothetical protein
MGFFLEILPKWKDIVFISFWPLWVVPLYLFIRRKFIKNKVVFFAFAMITCLTLEFLIIRFLTIMLFAFYDIKDMPFWKLRLINDFIFLIAFFVPFLIIYSVSKYKYFSTVQGQ